jgi:hypothetical protein
MVKDNSEARGKITLHATHPPLRIGNGHRLFGKVYRLINGNIEPESVALLHTLNIKIVILLAALLPLLHHEALPQHATVRCHSEIEHKRLSGFKMRTTY